MLLLINTNKDIITHLHNNKPLIINKHQNMLASINLLIIFKVYNNKWGDPQQDTIKRQ
jgi:hypothetical protein